MRKPEMQRLGAAVHCYLPCQLRRNGRKGKNWVTLTSVILAILLSTLFITMSSQSMIWPQSKILAIYE